jgi:hypothetical protein
VAIPAKNAKEATLEIVKESFLKLAGKIEY